MDIWILCIILFLWSDCTLEDEQRQYFTLCVCEEALGWNRDPTPSTPNSPHPTIPSARPAVFLYFLMTGLGPSGGPPPYLHPQDQGPGNISFSLLVPSRIGSNIAFWSPAIRSILSTGCEDPSLAISHCVLSFSLVAFYSFNIFYVSSVLRLCLALSLFSPFLRSPQAPQWDPCFPSQRFSALLSLLYSCSWEKLYLFIFWFRQGYLHVFFFILW